MTCQVCKKNPAVLIKFMPSLGKSLHVCVDCLPRSNISTVSAAVYRTGTGLHVVQDAFAIVSGTTFSDSYTENRGGKVMVCPLCGTEFSDVRRTKKLGCSNCYTVFSTQLTPIIKGIHGTTKHNGSRPTRGGV